LTQLFVLTIKNIFCFYHNAIFQEYRPLDNQRPAPTHAEDAYAESMTSHAHLGAALSRSDNQHPASTHAVDAYAEPMASRVLLGAALSRSDTHRPISTHAEDAYAEPMTSRVHLGATLLRSDSQYSSWSSDRTIDTRSRVRLLS